MVRQVLPIPTLAARIIESIHDFIEDYNGHVVVACKLMEARRDSENVLRTLDQSRCSRFVVRVEEFPQGIDDEELDFPAPRVSRSKRRKGR